MALKAGALTTVARLSGYMKITTPAVDSVDESIMQTAINAASSFIERYTGLIIKKQTYTEILDSERGQTLNLKHFPVISGESFRVEQRSSQLNEDNWQDLDSLYYRVDEDAGIIEMMDGVYFFRTRQGYKVTYTAGYNFNNTSTFLGDTEAGDIEIAIWIIAQDIVNNKGQDASIKSERIGDYSISYGDMSNLMFSHPQVKQILDSYKNEGADLGVLTPLQSI